MNMQEILSVTLILFSIIDMPGNVPVLISLQERGIKIEAMRSTLASGGIMLAFLFVGEGILSLFGLDIGSFAIAGAIVIFIIAIEMILGVEIFKHEASDQVTSGSVFPVAFPLIAGAGTLTTILSIKAAYSEWSIIIGIILNLVFIYAVIHFSKRLSHILGKQGTIILRRVFGIILLSIAVKLFKSNILLNIGH